MQKSVSNTILKKRKDFAENLEEYEDVAKQNKFFQ